MGDICTDGRFEIINRAKKDLLEATNIESREEEMKVLDSFLFRCWQMGWLKRYEIVRCGECKHRPIKDDPDGADYGFNIIAPTDGDDLCPCIVEDGWYSWMPKDGFYCGRGERRNDEHKSDL